VISHCISEWFFPTLLKLSECIKSAISERQFLSEHPTACIVTGDKDFDRRYTKEKTSKSPKHKRQMGYLNHLE
jgi:hypothetical protein